jgi:tetratricopeptide (TPR) repeat protein
VTRALLLNPHVRLWLPDTRIGLDEPQFVVLLNPYIPLWLPDPGAAARGEAAAAAGDWPRAVAALTSATRQPGASPWTWRDLLLVQAAAGQTEASRQTVANLVPILASLKDPPTVRRITFDCLSFACCQPEAGRLSEITRQDLARQRNADTLMRHGVALYRSSHYEQALQLLDESVKAHGRGGFSTIWVFRAMALRQVGRLNEARQQLARYEDWVGKQTFQSWQSRVYYSALLREGREVVSSPKLLPLAKE